MTNTRERNAIEKLRSIERAEQYLIARTYEELRETGTGAPVENLAQAMYRPILAIGLTTTFVWFLQIGEVSEFLAATV